MASSNVDKYSNPLNNRLLVAALSFLPAAALSGIIVYFVLSVTHISGRISIPFAILTSVIVFSLANYYGSNSDSNSNSNNNRSKSILIKNIQLRFHKARVSITTLAFTLVYLAFLIILAIDQKYINAGIFVNWNNITLSSALSLAAALAMTIYLPGFALVSSIDRAGKISSLGKHLLGYIFSIFISGLIGFVIATSGQTFLQYNNLIIMTYFIILAFFVVMKVKTSNDTSCHDKSVTTNSNSQLGNYWIYIVFASLLLFVILSSSYLFGTALIGDQLYHHSKALNFITGSFKDLVNKGLDFVYLPFMHGFLATLFSLSSVPSVNVYVTVGFLNMMPVFAFYYLFSRWFPRQKRAAILAACLFMIGSGFGWAHILSLASTEDTPDSQSAFNLIDLGGQNTFDVRHPIAFLNNGTITKPLTLFALPFGLILLGLLKENWKNRGLFFSIVFIITFGGLMSHEEFAVFLLVALVIQFVFRFNNSHYFFASVTLSLIIAFICLTVIFPPKSQVIREVLGVHFTIFLLVISIVLWSIYFGWSRVTTKFTRKLLILANKIPINRRLKLLAGLIIIAVTAYVYLFTFLTWSQLPFSDIHLQVAQQGARVVPWYLYPMRLGVPGLLALAYLLSYFFKKYERETLIFVIIAVFATLFTPFYDESRLNKYIMLSADGLASLLVYRIISNYIDRKKIITGFIIAGVIVSSGMSIIMYQGYMDLALQNPDANTYLTQRYLPQEISLLNFIQENIDTEVDNVALPNSVEHSFRRYQDESYFAQQVEGYSGIPLENRLAQASFILQSSTLEGLYSLINYSNTKYIAFPLHYIKDSLTEVGGFILNNFPRVYEDDQGVVVSVPPITEPSIPSETSVVLPQRAMVNSTEIPIDLKAINNTTTLSYTNLSGFRINSTRDNNKAYFSENNKTIVLEPKIGSMDLWFNEFNKKDNFEYFDVNLKVHSSEKSGRGQNHAGMILEYGNTTYYVFVRPHSVSVYNPVDKEFARNYDFIRQQDAWHNLKIVSEHHYENSYNVYVDNKHLLTFPKLDSETVMRVGVRAVNSITEFSPITVGNLLQESSMTPSMNYEFDKTMNYYFPVSSVALARMNYSTFFDGDLAIPSTKTIILTFDPGDIDDYLRYTQEGRTIVVLNTDNSFSGGFSKFLDIKPVEFEHFSGIENRYDDATYPKLSGQAMNISIGSPGSIVTSFYTNKDRDNTTNKDTYEIDDNDQSLQLSTSSSMQIPLAVEKKYGNGKIIFLNVRGLFDTIEHDEKTNSFLALEKIPQLIGLSSSGVKDRTQVQLAPPSRFIGGIELSGNTTIEGHNLFFPTVNELSAEGILSVNDTQNRYNLNLSNTASPIHVKNLTLSGPFSITIKGSDVEFLPSASPNAYIGFALSNGFDMKIQPTRLSTAQMEYSSNENRSAGLIKMDVSDGRSIILRNITSGYPDSPSVVVMIKNPTISINGKTEISELYSRRHDDQSISLANGDKFIHEGNLTLKLGHTDNFQVNGDRDLYATYIDLIDYDNEYQHDREQKTRYQKLSFPGDVSAYARENRIFIPIEDVVFSELNKKVSYTFIIVGIVSVYLSWSRIKKTLKGT